MVDLADLLRAFVVAFNRDVPASIRHFISPVFFVHAPEPGEPTAAEQWAGLADAVAAAFPDLRLEIDQPTVADGVATANAVLSGSFSRPLWNAPPTGKRVTWQTPFRVRAVEGRLAINIDLPPPQVVGLLRELDLVNPPDEMDRPQRHPVAWPEFLLQASWTGQASVKPCEHLVGARVFESASEICQPCVDSGDIWPALRMCLVCGTVGCCDTATNQHMKRHHEATGHPIFRSLRLAEAWGWCYADSAFFPARVLDELRG